ncbi:cell adhesion molecule Dscam2-like [Macrosteles quadrilineatus]|uniref:cell adhesion molecule Dscam2-like n=1 Tax=Macrosteles quadrilineatus TaxID=74068 RepID=UPI0023E1289F|nr:cell adhesion molecule Dscam2-like [Macrosteles quadrilineatus]
MNLGNSTVMTSCRSTIQTVTWLRDEPLLGRSAVHPEGRFTITSLGTLHVRDTTPEDSYVRFYCQTVHKVTGERRISTPGQIIVREPEGNVEPRIEQTMANVAVRVGTTAELVCAAQGSPPPTYRWYRKLDGQLGSSLQEIRPGSVLVRPLDSVLQFPRVQTEDAAHYVCVVNNGLGEDRRELVLTVATPLLVHIRPQHQMVDGGTTAMFNCSIQGGQGRFNINWLKDRRPLMESARINFIQRREVLMLKDINKHDRGMYQCLVHSGDESAQASAELALGAVGPELQSTFIEQTLQPGQPVSLRCVASGNPPPQFTWMLDGGPLLPRGGYILGSHLDPSDDVISHLNISVVRVQHGGVYTCLARNPLGSAGHSAALNVYGPPTPRTPLNITAVSGGNIYLRCPVSGFPISSTTWQRDGENLPAHYRHRVFANGTLLVRNVDGNTDKGVFHCTVRNQQNQAANGKIFVEVMKPPEIAPFSFPENLREGNRAHVSCSVISGDLPIDIIWHKDGGALPQDHDVQEQQSSFLSSLLFTNLKARHAGHYTCIARNAAAEANFTAKLVIKVAPTWLMEPHDISVLYQQQAALHCQAHGYPQPRITWMKARLDQPSDFVPLETDSRMFPAGNGSLLIRAADPLHEGHYSCEASNGIGNILRKVIFLRVNVPAHFRTRQLNQSGVAGESVILVCEAEGDLPLRVTWGVSPRLHVPPPHSRHTPSGLASEVHLPELTRQDAGAYHCNAHNEFGEDNMVIYLTVREPPDSPERLEVVEVGSRWLNVRWSPPISSHTTITQYLVQFQEEGGGSWGNVTVGGNTHSARLSGLTPATHYNLRLLAVNEVGAGAPSSSTTAITLQEAPSEAPEEVTVDATSADTLVVRWRAPSSSSHGEVVGYQVTYKEVTSGGAPEVRTVRGRQKYEMVLTGLKHYTRYEVTVRAFNQVGPGPASTPQLATTMEGVPDAPPVDIRCSAQSSQSIRIRWEPPPVENRNGIIQGYKVIYKQVDPKPGMAADVEIKKTTVLDTTLHGLMKYSNYSMRLLAFTHTGEGVHSQPIYCATEEDVPGIPEQIKALVMTSDSIMVTWTRPTDANGVIIKYTVYVSNGSSKEVLNKETVFGEELICEVRRLKEFQRYEFWVTASTSVGEGPSSTKVSQSPISRVPARIAGFSGKMVGVAGASLSLGCHAVGLPAPSRIWRGPTGAPLSPDFRVLSEYTLMLGPLTSDLAGNYTCNAENVFGRDQVVYQVVVLVPPGPPQLLVPANTMASLALQWKVMSDGGSPITGYHLHYRKKGEEWRQIVLDSDRRTFSLEKLSCGSNYEIFLQASNAVGLGTPSQTVQAATRGEAPPAPEKEDLILVNATSATVFLESWPSSGCPITSTDVAYKPQGQAQWSIVGAGVTPREEVVITDLLPATRYLLKVAAHSDAGTTRREYIFATRSKTGEMIPLEMIPEPTTSIINQYGILVPIIAGVVGTIAFTLCACIVFRKRTYTGYKGAETPAAKSLVELENQRNDSAAHAYSPSPNRKHQDSSLSANKGSDTSGADYEICPYATFSLPTQAMAHSLQFQTFSQRECYEGLPVKEYHYSRGRNKPGTSKSPPDGLSLEISCISSQQTLPVGRKVEANTAFLSDSDSSGGKPSHRRHPTPAHKNHSTDSTVFELDSSTESAEASPPLSRRVPSRPRSVVRVTVQPPSCFSDSRELSEAECDRDREGGGGLRLLRHEELEHQLSTLVNKYRHERDREKQDYTIHV